ncbi:SsrA-binding protein [candidate division CPR3 bacterium GWF2_35_18]|uniref:SsrA-binding protein n=1 Tax=candidate division CPR3 bacterium GW2011_GWF2_35_18 TaxID=1618350 RepID=A0A0G0BJ68_UNCC3|nr:MAG: SsrA-binding protein [candidate division CPR3 bacterium GW2011_GWF2_35_18]OGB63010.1 MAG: SsrA-binding protein [candidate division CPR3 bacterium GWF2_35_18]OGB63966.1 MAG: SsrA-binding protein [candidate division CPR3 bacterium RIFOXYA2_FULL_35_13]OGB76170.1 MAG: SsrA-binding protein [candidate division CPR3 bacterium RIFOXYC2_FULL_35_7]OGB78418.1 MAG: SsrA-binding protein [candidate division CPR3 bacterium RIFOXYB2_FULL_35_8]
MSQIFKVNKRASFDYAILETFTAGIALLGWEVKSVKKGNVSLKEGFVRIRNGEAILLNVHISSYQKPMAEEETTRTRKLLLQKREIDYLQKKLQAGLTIVPLKIFAKKGLIKLEIGLAQGRKKYDKREVLKKKAIEHDIAVALKERNRE